MTFEPQAGVPMALEYPSLPEEDTTTTPASTALFAAWAAVSESQVPENCPPPRLRFITSARAPDGL